MKTRHALSVVAVVLLLAPVVVVLGAVYAIPMALLFLVALPFLVIAALATLIVSLGNASEPAARPHPPATPTVIYLR